jgi:hypothetical protein
MLRLAHLKPKQGPLAAPGALLSCILDPPSARKATNRTFHDTSLREGDAEQCSPSSSGPPSLRHRFYSGLEDNFQIVDDALRALYAAGYWHARPVLLGSDVVTFFGTVQFARAATAC